MSILELATKLLLVLCGPVFVILFVILFLRACFDLLKLLLLGLKELRSKRFSLGQVFVWMVVCAIWMALSRNDPPLMIFGLVVMVVVVIMHVGAQRRKLQPRLTDEEHDVRPAGPIDPVQTNPSEDQAE